MIHCKEIFIRYEILFLIQLSLLRNINLILNIVFFFS